MTTIHLFGTLVAAIFLAGYFGGLVNFWINYLPDPTDTAIRKTIDTSMRKSIILGIGAASLVPLFLTTIDSHLIEDIRTEPDHVPRNILVFFGFCLMAAISSKAFIQSISKKILDEAREAKEKAQAADEKASEVQAAVEPILEREIEPEAEISNAHVDVTPLTLGGREKEILKRLATGKLLRTRTGLGRELGMSRDEVVKIMDELKALNLVADKEMRKADGKLIRRWHITDAGRDLVNTSAERDLVSG